MAVSLERFQSPDYQLTGELTEVPHLGGVTDGRLKQKNITSTYMLIGHFLAGNRDEAAFIKFLEEVETPSAHRKALADAIATRVAHCGVKVTVSLPSEVDGTKVSSKMTDKKAAEIVQCKFNNVLPHDFPGLGLGHEGDSENNSLKNLRANGITTTDQLFGAMLKHIGVMPSTEQVIAFWKELGAMGVAGGYKTTLIDAMKLKLDIGIDNCSRRTMPTNREVEEPSSPPGTGQQTRTRPLSADAQAASAGTQATAAAATAAALRQAQAAAAKAQAAAAQEQAAAAAAKAAQVKEASASGIPMKMILGAVVLAGVAYWLAFGGASAGPEALEAPGEWV